jgi:DNA-binding HxlR family transcriptional regulator
MPMPTKQLRYECPIELTLDIIGGKWKVLILWHLLEHTRRYSELRRRIPDVTEKMLIQQLRELESDGIIRREVFPSVPPRVEYSFTDRGERLIPALVALCRWGEEQMEQRSSEAA